VNDYEASQADITLRMTAQQARDFADALSDPDFRAELEENPDAAPDKLKEFGIEISPEFAQGKITWPDPKEIDKAVRKTDDAPGFRARHDETCFHVIVWFAGALARSDD
jgi:hypothetical protein